ncbi:MAG: VOC family protein [Bacteroidetes bacterium]|nr:MAG: VOC family protein [Bacteroidota bacterium]
MPKLEFLDHVAIRVKDPVASAQWYEKVLGLLRVQPEEWSPFPIMMLAGDSGIALFSDNGSPVSEDSRASFHFAFRVESGGLEALKKKLGERNVAFTEEDHTYFQSVYFNDPDGFRLEVTMKILDF